MDLKPVSSLTVVMDDEDGRCLLDVICDPEALNDFLHGSETHVSMIEKKVNIDTYVRRVIYCYRNLVLSLMG